jgi:hypothetical protein
MVRTVPIGTAQRSIPVRSAGERLGVGERHHVAGARDQRVLRVRHVGLSGLCRRGLQAWTQSHFLCLNTMYRLAAMISMITMEARKPEVSPKPG